MRSTIAVLKIQDMQAFYCGNLGQAERHGRPAHPTADRQTGIPGRQRRERLRDGATAFREAWTAIKARSTDTVLAVGVEKMSSAYSAAGGAGGIPKEGLFARAPCRPCLRSGHGAHTSVRYDLRQFAKVSVKTTTTRP